MPAINNQELASARKITPPPKRITHPFTRIWRIRVAAAPRARTHRLHFGDVCSCLTYLAPGCEAMGMEITAWRAIRGTHLAAADMRSAHGSSHGRNFRMKASGGTGSSPARRAVVTGGAGF